MKSTGGKLASPALLRDSVGLFRRHWPMALLAFLFASIPYIMFDLMLDDAASFRATSMYGLVLLWIQLRLTYEFLENCDALDDREVQRAFYPRAFGQSILYGLALIAGLLMFVAPGLIVAARWMPCVAIMIAKDGGAVASLRESWELTRGHTFEIIILMVQIWVPAMAGLAALFLIDGWVGIVISDVLFAISQLFFWAAAVIVYVRLRRG